MIALIAHDAKKPDLERFVGDHLDFFSSQPLVATNSTGKLLAESFGLNVERVVHGPLGGDLVIGGRVATGEIRAVFFFRDPLTAQPHDPDVSALLRVCDVHAVPLCTNASTAEAVIAWFKSEAGSA